MPRVHNVASFSPVFPFFFFPLFSLIAYSLSTPANSNCTRTCIILHTQTHHTHRMITNFVNSYEILAALPVVLLMGDENGEKIKIKSEKNEKSDRIKINKNKNKKY